jgi:hypothetical protein
MQPPNDPRKLSTNPPIIAVPPPENGIAVVEDVPVDVAEHTLSFSKFPTLNQFLAGGLTEASDEEGQTAWIGPSQNYFPHPDHVTNLVSPDIDHSFALSTFVGEILVMVGAHSIRAMSLTSLSATTETPVMTPNRIDAIEHASGVAVAGHDSNGDVVVASYAIDPDTLQITRLMTNNVLVDPIESTVSPPRPSRTARPD